MKNQEYVDAFEAFGSMLNESPVMVKHSGTQGATIECDTAKLFNEWDESGCDESWSNWLDGHGLEIVCSVEDCLNGDFPELELNVQLSIEFESENAAFQDECATIETIRILKGIIERLERADSNDEYINQSIFDVNGNNIGEFTFTIEGC